MLTFLTGLDTAGKRKYISEKICALTDSEKRVFLVVPEQSSFEREREFLFDYGEEKVNKISVTSFSHFSADVLEAHGVPVKPASDDTARSVIMSLVLKDLSDGLEVYKRFAGRAESLKSLIALYDEIRQAGLSGEELFAVSGKLEGSLGRKTRELADIFSLYAASLTERFSDASDNLCKAIKLMKDSSRYSDAVFFFDGFRGFTGAQLKFLAVIAEKSENTFVSVTAPSLAKSANNAVFEHSLNNALTLKRFVNGNGIRVFEQNTDTGSDCDSSLYALRNSLFGTEAAAFEGNCENIGIIKAPDIYGECELVALEIKRLLEKGVRCRDIAVFERGNEYAAVLIPVLRKYNIPVFEDRRHPLYDYPLTRLILSAVDIAANGFDTEKILCYVKTGLCGIDEDECALIENYVYCWRINYGSWERDFTDNPDGFGVEFTDDSKASLAEINCIRKKITEPLCRLRNALQDNSITASCKAVYTFLKDVGASENFLEYARYLYESGNEAQAVDCAGVWDECMSLLDSLNAAAGDRSVSPAEFFSLIRIMLGSHTLGSIPAGIDEIQIGRADRARFLSPEVVIVLGVNEGVFPATAVTGGIFTPREARTLELNGFVLENMPEKKFAEERLIVFDTLTCTADRLVLCCPEASRSGARLEESEIISEIRRIFPAVKTKTAADYGSYERLCTPRGAFEAYADMTDKDSVMAESLKQVIIKNGEFAGNLTALERAVSDKPFEFGDESISLKLFGKDLYSSASQTEVYHKCPFMYFCRYGMGVNKRQIAQVDSRITGLLVHKVMEDMFGTFTKEQLCSMGEDEIRNNVRHFVSIYTDEYMGGADSLNEAVKRDVDRSINTLNELMRRFVNEFGSCNFYTCSVELKIGGKEQDIPAYRLELPDGGSITVTGSIDRVDVMELADTKYVRVIDYKTGGKEFKLAEVFDGLNMQMLLYLFALCRNGKKLFGKLTPAGILYVPAKIGSCSLERNADEDEILKKRTENGRMNGLILENADVLRGMEAEAKGKFIAQKIDDKGELSGQFLNSKEFDSLNGVIDRILRETAVSIRKGVIPALPYTAEVCKYCDYAGVCLHGKDGAVKEPCTMTHGEIREMLRREDDDNG